MSREYDAIVVGGGAAGLLCAGIAAQRGKRVLIVEKMERPGRKLLITGKGRCNVTNNCDTQSFIAAVCTGGKFLYSAYNAFTAQDMMELVETLGVPLKTERGNRVFPVSDKSMDIVDALVRFGKQNNVRTATHTCAEILRDEAGVTGIRTAEGKVLQADSVVLATGGASYPRTGSTGDGYALARALGHTITPVRASLVPIETRENWCRDAMGLSLRNVTFSVRKKKRADGV